ncbi:MAG: T9SS type A sorting domain-containing protein [Ignavibacteria bacterium]|nr:T9SS type A sorting domain-containing protein [Ignavibacteria bacterium]
MNTTEKDHMNIRVSVVYCMLVATINTSAQWVKEGQFRRYNTNAGITTPFLAAIPAGGNAVFRGTSSIFDVHLTTGTKVEHKLPAGGDWQFLPRSPYIAMMTTAEGENTIIALHNVWTNESLGSVTAALDTKGMFVQFSNTWVADDGLMGCVLFGPAPGAPAAGADFQLMFFKDGIMTGQQRIKNKSDIDIYVMPHPDYEMLAFVRGNGITLYPNTTEEVFTYGSYLGYRPDGSYERLSLPTRGPGSGAGRRIVWSSSKWDRLLIADEAANGAILIKASNGIVVDSITSSKVDPGKPLTFLSASGSSDSRWMISHSKVGDKHALILWAMPETVEATSEVLDASDDSRKILPTSEWKLIMPFLKEKNGEFTLFAWDPEDIVSVNEKANVIAMTGAHPQPSYSHVTLRGVQDIAGTHSATIYDVNGLSVSHENVEVTNNSVTLNTTNLRTGVYNVVINSGTNVFTARFVQQR